MSGLYLLVLVSSLICLGLVDYRYQLALFWRRRQTVWTLALGIGFFLIWDVLGIVLDIFFTGNSPYILRVFVAPDLPIEEFFFLAVLMYSTIITYRWLEKRA
jgi:lycopene cyclase domain-containing protein